MEEQEYKYIIIIL